MRKLYYMVFSLLKRGIWDQEGYTEKLLRDLSINNFSENLVYTQVEWPYVIHEADFNRWKKGFIIVVVD